MTRSSTLLLLVVVLAGTSSAMPSLYSHSGDDNLHLEDDLTWDNEEGDQDDLDLDMGAEVEDHQGRHKRQILTGNLALDAARIPYITINHGISPGTGGKFHRIVPTGDIFRVGNLGDPPGVGVQHFSGGAFINL